MKTMLRYAAICCFAFFFSCKSDKKAPDTDNVLHENEYLDNAADTNALTTDRTAAIDTTKTYMLSITINEYDFESEEKYTFNWDFTLKDFEAEWTGESSIGEARYTFYENAVTSGTDSTDYNFNVEVIKFKKIADNLKGEKMIGYYEEGTGELHFEKDVLSNTQIQQKQDQVFNNLNTFLNTITTLKESAKHENREVLIVKATEVSIDEYETFEQTTTYALDSLLFNAIITKKISF